MSDFCALIVTICLMIGIPFSVVWSIVNVVRKKEIRNPIIVLVLSLCGIVAFTIIGSFCAYNHGEIVITQSPKIENANINRDEFQKSTHNTQKVEETENESDNGDVTVLPLPIQQQEVPETISIESEEQFKHSCIEVVYNDIDKEWIGKYVTKEILFTSTEQDEYQCASTESYVEDYSDYQHVYAIYDISDSRIDKSFIIYSGDVMQVYGEITDVKMNNSNGLYYPIIKMYYADYVRKWREPIDNAKSIDEITQERISEREKELVETEYFNSLNSDYNGKSKNIENMELLGEEDFKTYCDSMNFNDMTSSTEDLTGRYVKINIQLDRHKVFKSDDAKRKHLDDLVDIYSINNNVWYANLFCERNDGYLKMQTLSYFTNNDSYNIENLKNKQELAVYGIVLNYSINNGYHNDFDILVIYIE